MHSYRVIDRLYREHIIPFANFSTKIFYRVTIDMEKLASSLLVNSVLNKSPVAINERGGTLMGNRNEQPVACEARAQECSSFDLLNSVNIDAALVQNDPRNPEFTPCPLITFRVSKHAGPKRTRDHPSSFPKFRVRHPTSVSKLSPRDKRQERETCEALNYRSNLVEGRRDTVKSRSCEIRSDHRDTHGLRRSGALVGYQRGDSRRIHSWGATVA